VAARVQPLGQAVDGAALAGRIPPFKDDDAGPLLVIEVIAQQANLRLTEVELAVVFILVQRLGEVDDLKHGPPPQQRSFPEQPLPSCGVWPVAARRHRRPPVRAKATSPPMPPLAPP